MKLLTTANYKTVKGEKLGIYSAILYLAPAKISGYEVCSRRSPGCTTSCLYSAGMGKFSNVQQARINKTKWYFEDRPGFMAQLRKDIVAFEKKAKKLGMKPAIRLNGTSDLDWTLSGIMDEFPHITFYDYTKVLKRLKKEMPKNYHITFSRSEINDNECEEALKLGFNVAAVFDTKKGEKLPHAWKDHYVYDGDESDVRFQDPKGGFIIGLRAKGEAKKDLDNFVIKSCLAL